MYRLAMRSTLFLLIAVIAGSAGAVEVQQEKLGPLPSAVLSSVDDAKLWGSKFLKEAAEKGFSLEMDSCTKSPYGRHVGAVVPKDGGKCCVWLDGKEQTTYDQVRGIVKGTYRSKDFAFSPDGNRLAYAAKRGATWFMVVDGAEGPGFDGVREPYFSADSKHVCYVGFRGNVCVPVVDGKECGRYSNVKMGFPSYSARTPVRVINGDYCPVVFGGNRFAFVASKNGRRGQVVVIDGKESAEYEDIKGIEFSPDGAHVAYAALKGGKMFVVLDGKAGPKCDEIDGTLTFSPDGHRLAYVASDLDSSGDAQAFVVVDGKPGPKFQDVSGISVAFSPDSKHIAYTATSDGEKYCVVVDGKPGKAYEEIAGTEACALYSKDGRLCYSARSGDKCFMIIDGTHSPAYDEIPEPWPVFSPNGKHWAYAAQSANGSLVVKDGVAGPTYDSINSDSLAITDAGKLAYAATSKKTGKQVAVVDGVEHPGISGLAMSPDGSRIAFITDSGDFMNPVRVVIDGEQVGDFAAILAPRFNADNTLAFLAVRDSSTGEKMSKCLYRVQAGR